MKAILGLSAKAASAGGVGAGAALGLLALTEAGVPLLIPGDLLMLLLGERAAAGALPLWVSILAAEAVAFLGVAILFLLVRGPAAAVVRRLGPRVGMTRERLARVNGIIERRGLGAVAVGRATPGLRTATVVACATSGISRTRALAALLIGSTVFVQGHVLLGFVLGDAAREALDRAQGPIIVGVAVLAIAGLVFWIARRGGRKGAQSWSEASCPACLAVGVLARQES